MMRYMSTGRRVAAIVGVTLVLAAIAWRIAR